MTAHGGQPAVDGDGGAPLPATNGTAPHHHPGHDHQCLRANGTSTGTTARSQPQPQPQLPHAFPEVCYKLRHKVHAFLAEDIPASDKLLHNVQSQVRISVDVIEQALRRYSLDQISLSYNGGKDCLVLLILILACLPVCNETTLDAPALAAPALAAPSSSAAPASSTAQTDAQRGAQPPPSTPPPRPFQAIYIVPPDPFPEVDEFVDQSTAEYHLDLARYPMQMRAALDAYLADRPAVQAIFMGTRRTDPHGEFLTHFTPTDPGWPQFMRIHPVIDWHYAEIWAFIRRFDIPFCSLYNRGFTSLGGTTDTRPNPVLAKTKASKPDVDDHSGASTPMSFRPAYELMDDDEERLGRGR
ncbi:3'-phosphoadenosine 5'-phosphosulfate sulfotransferase [Sporothrix curviconia]|uniref:FAD synthase n=1 Tax=Sporothrix curviconia TaxID=1260050 RepID=A0ABP0BZY1_9PEZI